MAPRETKGCEVIRLEHLGAKYRTDKLKHRYLPHYHKRFECMEMEEIRLLEIGILRGSSLRMWRDYFPMGMIYGVDLKAKRMFSEDRIRTFQADQSDSKSLVKIAEEVGPFDIVIDDGSHCGNDQMVSFSALIDHVKSGGWYCVEDCHFLFNAEFAPNPRETILWYLHSKTNRLMSGKGIVQEITMIGDRRYDGLLLMRRR